MERPIECPICGDKIIKTTNAVTKKSYFKCANKNCHFVLSSEYTDAEMHLQGKKLQSCCIKCGEPLTIVNGPHGLYARCFECDCDTKPTKFKGKLYTKWANAHIPYAKEEIELMKQYTLKSEEDKLYDFEAYIATPEETVKEEIKPSKKKSKSEGTYVEKILNLLKQDVSAAMGSREISQKIMVPSRIAVSCMQYLKRKNLIKAVGYRKHSGLGNLAILYQTIEGPAPELTFYPKGKEYDSVSSFFQYKDKDRRQIPTFLKLLKDNGLNPVLVKSGGVLCEGYKISDMEKVCNGESLCKETPVKGSNQRKSVPAGTLKEQIISLFQENADKAYSIADIVKEFSVTYWLVYKAVSSLKKSRKVRIVGWDIPQNKQGSMTLKYQLTGSNFPKFKTTVNTQVYTTLWNFYTKRLRGKRTTSFNKIREQVEGLPEIPLIIKQRAYIGYAVADLKRIFGEAKTTSKQRKTVKAEIPIEVEAAVLMSKKEVEREPAPTISIGETSGKVSNPISKKKSLFSVISSLFKKEKVTTP